MARIINKLINIFVVIIIYHEGVTKSLIGSIMALECMIVLLFILNILVLRFKKLSECSYHFLSSANTKSMRILLPLLLCLQLFTIFFTAVNEILMFKYNKKELIWLIKANMYIIMIIFVDLDEFDYFKRSERLCILWIYNLFLIIYYCNNAKGNDTLLMTMRSWYFQMSIIVFTFTMLIMKVVLMLRYAYSNLLVKKKTFPIVYNSVRF